MLKICLMQYLQTFWTGPSNQHHQNLTALKAGWRSCEYHWMSWALSCLQAKKILGSVSLVTDARGREILVNQLKLPYLNISTALETTLDLYDPRLWALAKIYTYSIQTQPFLHLDGDVFFWQRPSDDFLRSPLIAQNLDKDLPMYVEALDQINKHFSFIPQSFQKQSYHKNTIYASNAGLIGGHDLSTIKKYCSQAFEFVERNKDALDKLATGNLNFIFEQFLFCQLAAAEGVEISYLNGVVDTPVYNDYIKFEDIPYVNIIHPVGGFKKNPQVCDHVAKTLRNDYPEYYYRIIEMVRKSGTEIRSAIYNFPGLRLETLPEQTSVGEKGLQVFKRTKAMIRYLEGKYNLPDSINAENHVGETLFLSHSIFNTATDNEKKCLQDVIQLDTKHKNLLVHFFDNGTGINKLYLDEADTYHQVRHVFTLPENDIGEFSIMKSRHATLAESMWLWEYDYEEEIPLVIERNLGVEQEQLAVVLLPNSLTVTLKEYWLDELDQLILSIAGNKVKVNSAIQQLEEYFDADEIANDYYSYKKLIINSIKHLLYAGVLEIFKE